MAPKVPQAGPDGTSPDYMAIVAAWSPEERAEKEKKLMRKIDYRLLPILVCLTLWTQHKLLYERHRD